MVGAFPRKEGMERKDLLAKNIEIFKVSWNEDLLKQSYDSKNGN